ncbi:ketoreductase [Verticillium alfalfae VaMs.102]|uniref:Ketoreductase n=1 Tax=Verticillium alfalfae (strain VaMs.102 / ATCC MYA-4576 / FGSC 10136) TaxID=526221 RepID=C9SU13_VERA1|nr:ketoreductase [Verticillium alfalfae VaMs.102]EEY22324.1 ketoreductase [Verticillium alfalfae VaMs.102]
MVSSSEQTILVIGANSYTALHIINELLQSDYRVRGAVRSQNVSDKVRETFPSYWCSRLEIAIVTDITDSEKYNDALDDTITAVIRTASPVHGVGQDNIRDMLNPAIQGAIATLDAVSWLTSFSCRRVVHLFSFSAMLNPAQGFRQGYAYSEKDFNLITSDEAAAIENRSELYIASKSLSERAVWDWFSQNKRSFDLVCINPSMILGPHLGRIGSTQTTSTGAMLWAIVDAISMPALIFGGCVDAGDCAAITRAAIETPETSGQRYLVAHHFDWQAAADIAREHHSEPASRIPIGEPGSRKSKADERIYQFLTAEKREHN